MRPLPVEPLSGMPPSVLGLSVIRGTPMPVVDAGRLLGAIAPRHPARFVTIKTRGRQVALAVDAVIGVRSLDGPLLEDLPPLLAEANAEVVSAIGTLDADLLLVLRSARLLPDFDWTALETRGGP
jgi:purine-binding chemotaxis protein CheW